MLRLSIYFCFINIYRFYLYFNNSSMTNVSSWWVFIRKKNHNFTIHIAYSSWDVRRSKIKTHPYGYIIIAHCGTKRSWDNHKTMLSIQIVELLRNASISMYCVNRCVQLVMIVIAMFLSIWYFDIVTVRWDWFLVSLVFLAIFRFMLNRTLKSDTFGSLISESTIQKRYRLIAVSINYTKKFLFNGNNRT